MTLGHTGGRGVGGRTNSSSAAPLIVLYCTVLYLYCTGTGEKRPVGNRREENRLPSGGGDAAGPRRRPGLPVPVHKIQCTAFGAAPYINYIWISLPVEQKMKTLHLCPVSLTYRRSIYNWSVWSASLVHPNIFCVSRKEHNLLF